MYVNNQRFCMNKNFQSVEDVLTDESFQSWFVGRSEQEVIVWEEWLSTRPDQQPLVNEAIQFMNQFKVTENTVLPVQTERALGRLNKAIEQELTPVVSMRKTRNRWWMAAAAVLLIGLGVVATW